MMKLSELRNEVINIHKERNLSHCASSLSCLDILIAIYYVRLYGNSKFILSKGHAKVALEVVTKYFNQPYDKPSCSLGNGLGIGCGMALLGDKVYVVMSDGECQEGSTWEAAMFAGYHKLTNLVGIIDYNKFQACGKVKDILDLEPLIDKWKAFGWKVSEVDGHNIGNIIGKLVDKFNKPHLIIAHTIKGKGLKDGENSNKYHYQIP